MSGSKSADNGIWVLRAPIVNTKHLRYAIYWFVVGMACLGLLIGFAGGLSSSPIVGVALPLLFALIGGSGGVYLTRVDYSDVSTPDKIRAAGISILAFAICVGLGGTAGVMLRLHYDEALREVDGTLTSASTVEFFELQLLSARLSSAGVGPAESTLALKHAQAQFSAWHTPVPEEELDWYLERVEALLKQLKPKLAHAQAQNISLPEEVPRYLDRLQTFSDKLSVWKRLPDLGGMTRVRLTAAQSSIFRAVTEFAFSDSDERTWATQHLTSVDPLIELFERIDEDLLALKPPQWYAGDAWNDYLNMLITSGKNLPPAIHNAEEIMPYMEH
ncbi:hypothetical protein [Candidatus Thiodiazotropha sp. CDECU1]|uniref:hypothetical protein n=1 Tax=Candidatus Thiodiazotropha sp. CDECU1 TaxID=3065865 RepID=UPI00292DE184|nr:hypothetical protein [Candidatus Thiodiazotropha sp. CDECU1]